MRVSGWISASALMTHQYTTRVSDSMPVRLATFGFTAFGYVMHVFWSSNLYSSIFVCNCIFHSHFSLHRLGVRRSLC
uniref:Uncharacterized protein n=1 Tax=Arundo donax TaxID=35708 RepID=A0A0A8Y565_ARUDO